jgi:hypothetical protein
MNYNFPENWHKPLTADEHATILRCLRDGKSIQETARVVNRSEGPVRRVMRENGIAPFDIGAPMCPVRRKALDKCVSLYKELAALRKKHAIGRTSIMNRIERERGAV